MAESDRKMIKSSCIDCGCDIYARPTVNKIRCRECLYKHNSSVGRIEVKCGHCSKIITKRKSSLRNSKHKIYFCDRHCKESAQSLAGGCNVIRPSHYGLSNGKHLWSILVRNADGCSCCKETKKYLLVVHHIDGDRENNVENNLEVICANCHMKRHLKLDENGNWLYDSKVLTPREMIKSL